MDDVRRNFAMNPQQGLRIRPFRKAHINRDKDQELLFLAKYLMKIAKLDSFSKLDHNVCYHFVSHQNNRIGKIIRQKSNDVKFSKILI